MVTKVFKINFPNVCEFIQLRDSLTPMIPLELLELEKRDGFGNCKPVMYTKYDSDLKIQFGAQRFGK